MAISMGINCKLLSIITNSGCIRRIGTVWTSSRLARTTKPSKSSYGIMVGPYLLPFVYRTYYLSEKYIFQKSFEQRHSSKIDNVIPSDFSYDGRLDLLVMNQESRSRTIMSVYLNKGSGQFGKCFFVNQLLVSEGHFQTRHPEPFPRLLQDNHSQLTQVALCKSTSWV